MFRKRLESSVNSTLNLNFHTACPSWGNSFYLHVKRYFFISFSDQFCTIIAPFWRKYDTFQTVIGPNRIKWDFCLLQILWDLILFFLAWDDDVLWEYQQYTLSQRWQASLVSQLDYWQRHHILKLVSEHVVSNIWHSLRVSTFFIPQIKHEDTFFRFGNLHLACVGFRWICILIVEDNHLLVKCTHIVKLKRRTFLITDLIQNDDKGGGGLRRSWLYINTFRERKGGAINFVY